MIQLQSILFPSDEVCNVSELYYRETAGRIDFNGYFNLFYIEKRKKYTKISNVVLKLQAQGYKKVILVHDGRDLEEFAMTSQESREYQIEFPYEKYDRGVFWFALIPDENMSEHHVKGCYASELQESECTPIRIGVDICTFKREAYVCRNLQQLKTKILDNKELDVSDHVEIFIIDNGQTLEEHAEFQKLWQSCKSKCKVVPNQNAGGAGGFTRGMLEVLKERRFSHVLLMDDDAVVEPDTLVRIYGLLVTIKDEWKNITIGGAMLREDYPYMLFCSGEWWEKGVISNENMHADLRELKQAASAYLTETGHEHDRYSGWWCCCYSMNTVREDNLPIPLFIHHDDIEFGLRNRGQGIVFLNGVGVWHRGAELAYPGANLYYDVRNNLIELALNQKTKCNTWAAKLVFKALISATIRLKYKDAQMVYQGFLDFLKGPEWLWKQNPTELHAKIRSMSYQMQPMETCKTQMSAKECKSVMKQIQEYESRFGMNEIIESRTRKSKANLIKKITLNGWFLPADSTKIKVIFPTDSPFDCFRKKKVFLYEPASKKGVILRKKYKELFGCLYLMLKAFVLCAGKFEAAKTAYRRNIKKITNKAAWEEYLTRK